MGQNTARNYFFEEIGKRLESEDIYIVSADLAGPPFDFIRREYPDRYVSVGIAEQNLISVACGIAMTGRKVIAYAANPFISFRAFDQVRNAVSLMNLPITIVGLGMGFSVWVCGTTHFVTEDVSMMSLCPGLNTITVSDTDVAGKTLEYILQGGHAPCYVRFDKDCSDSMSGKNFEIKKGWRYVRNGERILIIAQGYTSQMAHSADYGDENPSIMDIVMTPLDSDSFASEVKKYERLIVIEEQQLRGGLGSIVLEILNEYEISKPVKRMGIDYGGRFPEFYGSREYMMEYYHIGPADLVRQVREWGN